MGAQPLVIPDLEKGRAAVEALDRAGLSVRSAFWLYFKEAEEWRLVVATPHVERKGPLAAYKAIHNTLTADPDHLPLRQVTAIGVNHRLRRAVAKAVKTGTWLASGVIDSVIDDAYVYRST